MNEILIFSAIILLGIVPFCIFLLRLIFRQSIIFNSGIVILLAIAVCVILSYIVGQSGLIHLLWAAPIGVISLFTAYYLIAQLLQKPLKILTRQINQLTNGDLTTEFDFDLLNRTDELGDISQALNAMVQQLTAVVEQVIHISAQIEKTGQHLQQNSEEMTEGVNHQASSAEQASASMQEMTSIVENNVKNAEETQKIASNSADSILTGSSTTEQSAQAMKHIADKISIISEIAFQTNILALNAAIEAARAGQYGKGFAVVAAEVRNLAERSGKAAEEIEQKTAEVVKISDTANLQFKAIIPEIERTVHLIREITTGSKEQGSGAQQINTALLDLNRVIQANTSIANSISTASGELAHHSQDLQESVAFFKTA